MLIKKIEFREYAAGGQIGFTQGLSEPDPGCYTITLPVIVGPVMV